MRTRLEMKLFATCSENTVDGPRRQVSARFIAKYHLALNDIERGSFGAAEDPRRVSIG